MAVTVYFVGVMLFVLDRPDVEVWLPDAQIGTDPPEGRRPTPGSHGEHCDSTAARAHWPGVFVTDQNGTEIKRFTPPLGQVRISGGPGKTTGAGTLAEVAALDKINNNGSQEDLRLIPASTPNRVAAHVTIRGGTIGPEVNSDLSWDIGFQHNPSHGQAGQFVRIVSWTSDTDEAELQVSGHQPYSVADGLEVYVYNFDGADPSRDQLREGDSCRTGSLILDLDFKWLYQLVDPINGKHKDRIKPPQPPRPTGPNDPELVIPWTTCDLKKSATLRAPDVSTCLGGSWGGGG